MRQVGAACLRPYETALGGLAATPYLNIKGLVLPICGLAPSLHAFNTNVFFYFSNRCEKTLCAGVSAYITLHMQLFAFLY